MMAKQWHASFSYEYMTGFTLPDSAPTTSDEDEMLFQCFHSCRQWRVYQLYALEEQYRTLSQWGFILLIWGLP